MTFRYDAMDISIEQLQLIKEWVRLLEEEKNIFGGGICVPIKQELQETKEGDLYYDEWQPSEDWGD